MTDRITKVLRKSSEKNRRQLLEIFQKIKDGKSDGLDVRSVSRKKDLYRIRSGKFRILIQKKNEGFEIFDVRKRDDQTYHNL
jgi:mRNA-degrading endonuclease RelE of RelBE toxin-antitoxin system